ncbi:hypothetical protein J3F83DRAFT_640513 [Trichoderma novae-zelandiae]
MASRQGAFDAWKHHLTRSHRIFLTSSFDSHASVYLYHPRRLWPRRLDISRHILIPRPHCETKGIMASIPPRRGCAAWDGQCPCEHHILKARLRFSAAALSYITLSSTLAPRSLVPSLPRKLENKNTITRPNKKHTISLTLPIAARRPMCEDDIHIHIISHPCPLSSSPFSLTVDDDSLFSFFKQESGNTPWHARKACYAHETDLGLGMSR